MNYTRFLPPDSMYNVDRCLSVCLSVRPSVRPSHSYLTSKRLKTWAIFIILVAPSFLS